MVKNPGNIRDVYQEKINAYLSVIETMQKEELDTLTEIQNGSVQPALTALHLSGQMLNLVSVYIAIDGVSRSVLKTKDDEALNNARKSLHKCLKYLESAVTKLVDAPFSEYEKQVDEIAGFTPAERYLLVRKTGLTFQLLKNAYADNTKWKWAFVEMEGRYAATAKNLLNLREITVNKDPRSPHYEPTVYHLRLTKKLLLRAAEQYRQKYELSPNRFEDFQTSVEDFKKGILFLSALKRFCIMTGDSADAEIVQKKLDAWNNKLNADTVKQQQLHGKK